jgi:hypothetical protein
MNEERPGLAPGFSLPGGMVGLLRVEDDEAI